MNREVQYTKGKTKHYVRVLVDPEIHKALVHESAETNKTIAEIANLVLCAYFGRDPGDPSKRVTKPRLKAAS